MKYIKQLFIIMIFAFMGEVCRWILPLPIPASIYGMVFLFLALCSKKIRLNQVRDTADFLIEIMPFMFIPPGVKLLIFWEELKSVLIPVTIIIVVSTIAVMAVSGFVVQKMLSYKKHKQKHNKN